MDITVKVCQDQLICPILYVFLSETSFKLQFYLKARVFLGELNVKREHSRSYDPNWEPKPENDHNWSCNLNWEPMLMTTAGAAIFIESKKLKIINEPKLKGYLN
jgi:hypothetical protein